MTLTEFAEALSKKTGNPVEINDDAIGFSVGGLEFFVLSVLRPGVGEYLVMAADLGDVPPERPEKLYQALLEAGHYFEGAGGGVFSRDPENGRIWLQWREPISAVSVESAMEQMQALEDAALKWRDIIKDYREGSALPSTPSPSDSPPSDGKFDLPGFMSV